jgi:hypothetical protein
MKQHYMDFLLTLGSLLDFRGVVSDTYTLIVGFVAIGIPLSIQFAGQAAEKYDNPFMAKRLTTGGIINPVTIILLSIFYITISFLTKSIHPKYIVIDFVFIQLSRKEIEGFLLLFFLLTISISALFYIRFYLRIVKSAKDKINDFLLLEQSRLVKTSKRIISYKKVKLLADYVEIKEKEKGREKYKEYDLPSISAGLEILVEQLDKKNTEDVFVEIVFDFDAKITQSYFGYLNESRPILDTSDYKVIKLYWQTLIKIVKISRKNFDSRMSFHSQRILATLVTRFIHHPQQNEFIADNFNLGEDDKVNWTTDLYEIARWQSQQSNEGIDLVLECEWVKDISGELSENPDIRYSCPGTLKAFSLFESILQLVAEKHPEKLYKLYDNISRCEPYIEGQRYPELPYDPKTKWIYDFISELNQVEFSLSDESSFNELFASIANGKAYIKHAPDLYSRPLNDDEIKIVQESISFKDLYYKAFLEYYNFMSLKFVAVVAYYKQWKSLHYCLESQNPRESQTQYCNSTLLPSDLSNFTERLLIHALNLQARHWFLDRHDIGPYAYRGGLFILLFFCERDNSFPHIYVSGSNQNILLRRNVLEKLINQSQNLKNNGVYGNDLFFKVVKNLSESLLIVEESERYYKLDGKLSVNKWRVFSNALSAGWYNHCKPDFKGLIIPELLNISYDRNIHGSKLTLINKQFSRDDFVDGFHSIEHGEFWGRNAFRNVVFHIYNSLFSEAFYGPIGSIASLKSILMFGTKDTLKKYGFVKIKGKGYWQHSDKMLWIGISTSDDKTLVVNRETTTLNITRNTSSEKDNYPLFPFIIDKNKEQVNVIIDVYIEIKKENDQSCIII